MGWASIIAALSSFLGPILVDWLKKCAEKKAQEAAAGLPAMETFASETEARRALFAEMDRNLPRWAKIRRALLTRAAAVAEKHNVTSATTGTVLDTADADELKNLANAASEE